MAGRVVGDDIMGDALLREFPCGERGALAARTRLVAEDVELPPQRLRRVERCRRGADVHEGQPTGVAMGQHAHAVADERRAVDPDLAAMGDVLVGEMLRGGERQRLLLGHGLAGGHRRPDVDHGVHRIHRRRTRLGQRALDDIDVRDELRQVFPAERPGSLGQSIRRSRADGPRPAHHHVGDGRRGRPEIPDGHDLELVRQQALLDEQHRVLRGVETNGAERAFAPSDGDVHGTEATAAPSRAQARYRPPRSISRPRYPGDPGPAAKISGRRIFPPRSSRHRRCRALVRRKGGEPPAQLFQSKAPFLSA